MPQPYLEWNILSFFFFSWSGPAGLAAAVEPGSATLIQKTNKKKQTWSGSCFKLYKPCTWCWRRSFVRQTRGLVVCSTVSRRSWFPWSFPFAQTEHWVPGLASALKSWLKCFSLIGWPCFKSVCWLRRRGGEVNYHGPLFFRLWAA